MLGKRILLLAGLGSVALSRLLTSISQLSQRSYDFVIVGAGTAGSVLAARLSENSSVSVLLVEAGISNDGILNLVVPFLGTALPGTSVDWNFTSVAQPGLNNRSLSLPRGYVLGGTSSINLLTWNRGSMDLWDNIASLTSDSGWSWSSVAPYYKKACQLTPPADGHSTTGQVDPSAYGTGPVEVSLPGYPTELDSKVTTAAGILGGRFAYTQDVNAGISLGTVNVVSSIGGGERSSSATAYLLPAINRVNLDVLISTRATRLISTTTSNGKPVFNRVKLEPSVNGSSAQITASKEVIVSAGAFGTPQLLLLSGIGPSSHLNALNISVAVNSPAVGQNLADHANVPIYFTVDANATTFDNVFSDPSVFNSLLSEWQASRTGLFTTSPANTLSFLKNPQFVNTSVGDPSSGPKSANIELIYIDGFVPLGIIPPPANAKSMSIFAAVVSPKSRGSVTLASTNPFDAPLIDPGYLTDQFDISTAVQAMKDAASFVNTSPFASYITGTNAEFASANTDALKATYARKYANTFHHAMGTAAMGPTNSPTGVLDSQLRVKGTSRLRVVDASVFPQVLEIHPQAAIYTVAERAADLIKADYGL